MTQREEGVEDTLLQVIKAERKCLVPYITGGFNGYLESISAAAEAGADAIEIGIPFSDPVMDGPTIQEANDLVLSAGVSPLQIIDEVASLDVDIPLAVMTYYNVVYRFGLERFAYNLNEARISGIILPDLPLVEAGPWVDAAASHGREAILLAAPTTTDIHLKKICNESRGFVYAVGLLGTTGARKELADSAKIIARRCKELTKKPVLVGVGIGNPDQAMEVAEVSDGCIVGSAIVQKLLDGGGPEAVGKLVSEFRSALDNS
ncbi:MAG: tryptophan synthase subunit alpha [Acidimicrobiaceae bacterium]|jgi:tryptophan synthase alpha chain|nr:tryptophan synthase subunit alpha [Acidimicrobiaceae bacterium]|tara:strand:- start:86441 stop:87226 length:786 start_codon:yes stop_codon:yes gene_type:complete